MFIIAAAILFGLAALLDIINAPVDFPWIALGLLCMALYFALGSGVPWRRTP
jgi:hypothetical protein